MKNLVFTLLSLIFNFSIYAQIIYVKPGGTGLKNGSSWANALDGNSPAGDGYTKLADSYGDRIVHRGASARVSSSAKL